MADNFASAVPLAYSPPTISFEPIWRGPLVPVAIAATGGMLLDRWFGLPFAWTMFTGVVAIAVCLVCAWRNYPLLTVLMLWTAVAGLGSAYHHLQRDVYPAEDIGYFATAEPQPVLLRGFVETQPLLVKRGGQDELRSFPAKDGGRFILQVAAIKQQADWQTVSGRAQIQAAEPSDNLHVGDEVEVAGRLAAPAPPANPGEFDYASMLRDQRLRAVMSVKESAAGIRVMGHGSRLALGGALAGVRAWGQRVLCEYLPARQQGVAVALLLGDGAPMTQDDWEKYVRSGVIHVLAISGQHLVVLAAFLALILRMFRMRLRQAAVFIAVFLLCYALLVGGRAPVMRAVVAVCGVCGALWVRRPVVRANIFALAWIVVAVLNPMDLFTTGCQLSFLAVAVLTWGTSGWHAKDDDPAAQLAQESRSPLQQMCFWVGRQILLSYAVTLAVWVVVAPLVAARHNVLSPVGLVIGPPTVLLTSIALLSGFALLLLALICPPLAPIAAWITQQSLAGCEGLVAWSATWPGACWYVPTIPQWWLWVFYAGVLGLLMLQSLRRFWTLGALAMLVFLAVGLVSGAARPRAEELRCTFLAVGHGGCVVLETPGGQTLLYDVGSLTGPELVRMHVAPYLWQRGIRRIDEVFLSHADLDHFNGLTELFERFAVGQVSCTPTFQDRPTPAVRRTLDELRRRAVPLRMLTRGQRLWSGEVELEVLHPPPLGPEGNENSRSLVLLLRHAGHSILLTGDLEGTGLEQVTALTQPPVDVMQAPHHGNRLATAAMIHWAKPQVVVSSQGQSRAAAKVDTHKSMEPPLFATWPHGAVTVFSREDSLVLQTFVTKQSWRVR